MVAAVQDFHPEVVQAVIRNADYCATLVAACLDVLDKRLKEDGHAQGAQGLPTGFLLELGTVLQLKIWEQQGLREFLPADLPTFAAAMADLHRRVTTNPLAFQSIESNRLGQYVLQVELERLSWAAPELLEADMVITDVDDDALVEAVAQLLWVHRHDAAD